MTRTLVVTALLVGVGATIGLAALPAFDTTRLYNEATFAAAITPYTDAIARTPNDGGAYYWLGVAYLHGARLAKMGLAPYAAGFAPKAVAALEQAARLRPAPPVLLALLEAYSLVGDRAKYDALIDRVGGLAAAIPPK